MILFRPCCTLQAEKKVKFKTSSVSHLGTFNGYFLVENQEESPVGV